VDTLGRVGIVANFHCQEATDYGRDRLNISTSGAVKIVYQCSGTKLGYRKVQ